MRSRAILWGLAGVFLLVAATAAGQSGTEKSPAGRVKYPEGYRGWIHLKSMVIHEKSHPLFDSFGGIHHVYVNSKGARAARAGGPYPDGAILVFDLLEAKAEGGAMVEGSRKFIGVMAKDSKTYPETGGWGFEAFRGNSRDDRLVTEPKGQCFACHQAQKAKDYVYSEYRR